jgi:uncharacterized protein
MKIINTTKNTILADKARVADNVFTRLMGLLNRVSLEKGEALVLVPSNSIHSLFMRFAIDVIFIDKGGRVIAAQSSFKPFSISPVYFNSHSVIELPEGTIQFSNTKPGDTINLQY